MACICWIASPCACRFLDSRLANQLPTPTAAVPATTSDETSGALVNALPMPVDTNFTGLRASPPAVSIAPKPTLAEALNGQARPSPSKRNGLLTMRPTVHGFVSATTSAPDLIALTASFASALIAFAACFSSALATLASALAIFSRALASASRIALFASRLAGSNMPLG